MTTRPASTQAWRSRSRRCRTGIGFVWCSRVSPPRRPETTSRAPGRTCWTSWPAGCPYNGLERCLCREHCLQAQVREAGVVGGAGAVVVPVVQALGLGDGEVVDAGVARAHQAVLGEFPVLVAVGAEPVARVVVVLVGEPDGDAV